MAILFDAAARTFTLSTQNTTYQMGLDHLDRLLHLYYGPAIGQGQLSALYPPADRGFSPNANADRNRRGISPDTLPQEYTGCNVGDFRLSCLVVRDEDGAAGADWHYVSHSIQNGKYSLEGLPSAHDEEAEAETLCICLKDEITGLSLELLYGVFAQQDVITRGASSHHHNPFVILCDRQASEEHGLCYGVMPVYSGSHRTDVETDQNGLTRIVSGIHDERFSWQLEPGEAFTAPEVILACTNQGLTALSHQYHQFVRRNIGRSQFRFARRPVLINNWEATYFDFDSDAIVRIAQKAADLGVEMLVLDDGWFGKRNDDNSGLGDWFVNETKLKGGLQPLIERVKALGMKFGIWVEPEMVSEDSDLFRAHPDWALTLPGRAPVMSRNQMVLDLGRPEMVDYLIERLSELLERNSIDYVKWDMNRNMTDVYSRVLPAHRQGEAGHRYMLGVYRLLDTLTTRFPHVLFEGCAGGGGRFDAGMLAYFTQIWCSDNTDAIERLIIQHGTSYGYPVSAVGAHVSACPNHQTGRTTPIWTRAVAAMAGTFGYELDLNKISPEEAAQVKEQIAFFDRHYHLIQDGRYYRLTDPTQEDRFAAWQFVKQDETLANLVLTHPEANPRPLHLWLRGLEPDALYRVETLNIYGCHSAPQAGLDLAQQGVGAVFSGSTLMNAGYTLTQLAGDYPSVQLYLTRL